jgi:molybdate transport system substrate-binding protein
MLVSEILPVKGVEIVATVPAEIQEASVFSAAVVKGAKDVEAAKKLIAFLASQSASAAIHAQRNGAVEPQVSTPLKCPRMDSSGMIDTP